MVGVLVRRAADVDVVVPLAYGFHFGLAHGALEGGGWLTAGSWSSKIHEITTEADVPSDDVSDG